jgi:hypothetical protein
MFFYEDDIYDDECGVNVIARSLTRDGSVVGYEANRIDGTNDNAKDNGKNCFKQEEFVLYENRENNF